MSKCSKYPVDLTKFKSVNFEIDKHKSLLTENTIVIFKYGINLPNSYNMMGKIVKVHTEKDSLDVTTKDRGIRTTIPSMIEKIFLPKDKIAEKENRIKCITNGNSPVPRFDAAIDKVIFKTTNTYPSIFIEDIKVNTEIEYNRQVKFTLNDKLISLILLNKDTDHILLYNSLKNKNKQIFLTKYGIDTWSIIQLIKELNNG